MVIGAYPELIAALDDGDGRPLRFWLTERLVQPGGPLAKQDLRLLDSLPRWNATANRLDGQPPVLAAVRRSLAAAATVDGAAPMLVLYLKYLCDQAWENAWFVDPVLNVMRYAAREWSEIAAAAPAADPELTALAIRTLAVLDNEMATFNAASCGSLAQWSRHSARTAALAAELATEAATLTPAAVAMAVAERAAGVASYYRAQAEAVQAVHQHFTGGGADLAGAVGALRAAEESLPDGVERSELRAHRYNVEVLAAAAGQRWLRLDHGKVIYLYPFGLYADTSGDRGSVDPDTADLDAVPSFAERMVEQACRTAELWTIAGWSIAEQPQLVAQELLLDDIWKGDDPLGREYSGMAVNLPDLRLADVDRPGDEPLTFRTELRLSRLGNHYLRLECELSEANPQQVYAAMLRAAPEFGDLVQLGTPLRPAEEDDPDRTWRRLSDFATEVIEDAAAELARHCGLDVRSSVRPGMYHVVVSVDRAVLVSPDGRDPEPLGIALDAAAAVGAQPLCHPVRHGFSSLAEWLRYPVVREELPVVDVPRFSGDLLLRTCNTTLIVNPGTPDFMLGTVEETAEFVASLDGMFAGWQDQIAEYHTDVKAHLARMLARLDSGELTPDPAELTSAAYERITRELGEMQGRLEAQQLRLHQFVMASRLSLMFVTSPALVTSPVVRTTIDGMLGAAKFDTLRRDFEGMIDQVLGDRIGALVDTSVRRQQERNDALARAVREEEAREAERQRLREERAALVEAERERVAAAQREARERANRRRNDVLLGGIAAVGLSGLMQIVQAGYDLKKLTAALLVAIVLVAAVAIGWVLHKVHPDQAYDVSVDPGTSPPSAQPAAGGTRE